MSLRSVLKLIASVFLLLTAISPGHVCLAQQEEADSSVVFDFTDAVQPSAGNSDLPWIESIAASHYGGSMESAWGGYGNRIYPQKDYFVALPAVRDDLDCLGGHLACRISRCGDAQPVLDELLSETGDETSGVLDAIDLWPGDTIEDSGCSWVIEGTEGDGLFRVIEIKPSGCDGPIIEAYVGDVGPWRQDDPYWATGTRPDAEDGVDSRGRRTNRAGIDVSWALAQALGFTGMLEVDWRWKTIDGAYVVRRQPTEWRW
jgi:hypothetical protein